MAIIVLKDRVKETSSTTGTGSFALAGAVSGYQSFAAIGNGNTTYYAIYNVEDGEWEVGKGTYSTTGPTLSRDTVLSSSSAGTKVDFAAGVKDVFVTYPAEKAIYEELNGNTRVDGGPLTIIGTGAPSDPTTFSAALAEMYASVNSYAQAYARNFEADTEASADFIVYRDNTVNENGNFMDMGINSSTFDSATWPIFTPGSMYLYGNGGEMFIGSETSDVVFFAGGVDVTDEVGRFSHTTGELTLVNDLNVTTNVNAAGGTFTAPVTSTSTSVTSPSSSEFVVRSYVDSATSTAFVVHPAVRLATAAALATNTYNNGTSGVGATLTATGNGALSVDGVAVNTNDRILVKNESNQAHNGAYVVTQTGDGSNPYVLTRATDFDTTGAGEITNNAYFYVTAGSTNIGSSWILAQTAAITVGTTALPFSLFASPIGYTVNAPLNLTGTTLSLSGVVDATNGGTGTGTVATGDLLYGSATNTWSKLTKGSAYGVLTMDSSGTNVQWNAVNLASSNAVTGTLGATYGGTGQSTYATGDILYSSASNTLSKLSGNTTTTKKFLTQTGTGSGSAAPAWDTISGSDVTSAVSSATNVAGGAANKIVYQTGASTTGFVDAPVSSGTALTWNGSSFAWATVGATITDDTTTNTDYYPVWANASSGSLTTAYVSSTKFKFNPSTGTLTCSAFSGPLTGNVTGNVSGSSGSCTGNAATATSATTAGSVTNAITFNTSGGAAAGTTYNGSAARTIDYSTVGAQATLVSGTNIKTVNGSSLLGSGNLTVSAAPGGSTTQIQYNSSGTFAGSSNLTFDGTNLTCGGTVSASSDETVKTNWRDLPADFVELLAKVKHGTYDRTDLELTQDGVSAQSLRGVLPNSVLAGEDGKLSVAYGNAALVAAIALAERVVQLEATVAKLTQGSTK